LHQRFLRHSQTGMQNSSPADKYSINVSGQSPLTEALMIAGQGYGPRVGKTRSASRGFMVAPAFRLFSTAISPAECRPVYLSKTSS